MRSHRTQRLLNWLFTTPEGAAFSYFIAIVIVMLVTWGLLSVANGGR